MPRVDETSSANFAMSTKHYNCEKVKFYVVVAVSSKASVIFLILCLRPHPSKRGRVRLQSLDMSITQQPQSQQALSYATEPSVAQGAPDNGGGLGDLVHLPVLDRVSVGEELQWEIGEEADVLRRAEYVSPSWYLHQLSMEGAKLGLQYRSKKILAYCKSKGSSCH